MAPKVTTAMKQCRAWLTWYGLLRLNKEGTSTRKNFFLDGPEVLALCKNKAVDEDANKREWKKQFADRIVACGLCKLDVTESTLTYEIANPTLLLKILDTPPDEGNRYLSALLFPAENGTIEKLLAAESGQLNVDEDTPDELDEDLITEEEPEATVVPVAQTIPIRRATVEEASSWDQFSSILKVVLSEELQPQLKLIQVLSTQIQAHTTFTVTALANLVAKLETSITLAQQSVGDVAGLREQMNNSIQADLHQLANNSRALSDLSVEVLSKMSTRGK